MKVVDILKKLNKQYEIKNEAPESFDWLVLDLSLPGALELVRINPSHVICFVSHMRTDLIADANSLGCEHVYSNGHFSREAMDILAKIE